MTKSDRIYIRVTPELKEQLEQLAAAQNRTISNLVETLLKEALDKDPKGRYSK